jgi:DNA-binding XRE family transcriptional regulator
MPTDESRFFRYIRKDVLHLTRDQLAELLDVKPLTIYRWETGIVPLHTITWLALIGHMALKGLDYSLVVDRAFAETA